jgi:glycosyltransferase involved in cell wall biosynthesis
MEATRDRPQAQNGTGAGVRPTALVIGPLPPPWIGPAIGTQMVRQAFERGGVEVVHVNTQDSRGISQIGALDPTNVVLAIVHAVQTAVTAARRRIDIAYIPISQGRWGYARDAVLMAILRLLRRRYVVHLRGSEFQDFIRTSSPLERFVIRRTLSWSERAIALTPNLEGVFAGVVPRERIRVLENAIVDPYPAGIDELRTLRAERAAEHPRALNVLYIANLFRLKGAFTLVRALARPGLEHVHVRLLGDPPGSELPELRELAKELGVADRVDTPGSVGGAAKAVEFRWADAFAHPTEAWDGQPVALIEAMAAGLPIVSTSYAGIPHTLGGTGIVIEPGDLDALAAALRSLVDDPGRRVELGDAARARFVSHYTPEPYQRRFTELFGELVPMLPCAD